MKKIILENAPLSTRAGAVNIQSGIFVENRCNEKYVGYVFRNSDGNLQMCFHQGPVQKVAKTIDSMIECYGNTYLFYTIKDGKRYELVTDLQFAGLSVDHVLLNEINFASFPLILYSNGNSINGIIIKSPGDLFSIVFKDGSISGCETSLESLIKSKSGNFYLL